MRAERTATGLVEIFRNDRGARYRRTSPFQQHRRRTRRIERQKLFPSLPRALFDKRGIESVLNYRDADEPGVRTERMMEQGEHRVAGYDENGRARWLITIKTQW